MASSAVPGDSQGGAEVTEGKATIYFPSEKGVFYNPPQIPNRDLSVLAPVSYTHLTLPTKA